jgi:hypothetical protein
MAKSSFFRYRDGAAVPLIVAPLAEHVDLVIWIRGQGNLPRQGLKRVFQRQECPLLGFMTETRVVPPQCSVIVMFLVYFPPLVKTS